MVGTGRFELPTPRTPSECSTRLSHVPTQWSRSTEADRLFGVLISLHQMDRGGDGAAAFVWSAGKRVHWRACELMPKFQRLYSEMGPRRAGPGCAALSRWVCGGWG